MKKRLLAVAGAAALLAIGVGVAFYLQKKGFEAKPKHILGELKILSRSPEGDTIPISTDGISVMFNKAVVPLTTLDSGRDRKIPLEITPPINGKFFWLGTHGFIFRPKVPLLPATLYKVTLPAGIVSIDGYRLEQPISWEFKTVAPRTLAWSPGDNAVLLPKTANFFLRFNLAMNASDVEKKLSVVDSATGQLILAKRHYVWGDNGHTLTVQFKDGLPWASSFKVTLPQGVKAKKGDLGTMEPVTVTYATPPKTMELEKVYSYDFEGHETVFRPGQESVVKAEGGICFRFTQPIDKKSFEKAFKVETVSGGKQKPPLPYFYFLETAYFSQDLEGYKEGCASFLENYDTVYRFSIDPKKIESLSGAPLEANSASKGVYLARTDHALPDLKSVVTKNILSHKGPMKIPYRGINLKSVTARLYRWTDQDSFNESVKSETLYAVDKNSDPPTASFTGGWWETLKLPVDPATMTVDQERMPAEVTAEVPLDMKPDDSTHFSVDLAEHRPAPGLYLLEVIGIPLDGVKKTTNEGRFLPGAVYSMLQVTPIGLAVKHESDHTLVWATDIESGAPVASLPLRVSLKKWDSSLGKDQTVLETNLVTNSSGVALWNQPADRDLKVCVEVTQPGSESVSCERDHKLTGYRSLLKAAPHYFGYLYTDRPIYRPGQKVFFSSFLRQVREGRYFQMADRTPAVVTITDAAGAEVYKDDAVLIAPDGVVHGEFPLDDAEDLPRGRYSLAIRVGDQSFTKIFMVASYRKPSFKVDMKAEKPEIVSGDKLEARVQGSYFFGAPMRKSKTAWSIMTSTYRFSPEGFEDYSFIDEDLLYKKDGEDGGYVSDYEYDILDSSEDQSHYDNPAASDDTGRAAPTGFFEKRRPASLDDKGFLKIAYQPDLKKYPTSQILTVEANIQDPSHQEVSASEDIIVHKAHFYLGVKPEKWTYGSKETANLDVVSLDTHGKPVGSKSFKVDVVRRDYKFIERRTSGGYWDFVYMPEDTKLATLSGKTGGDGKGSVSYQIPQGGTFRMVVRGADSAGNEIQSATTVYAWGEGYVPWRLDKPESIELVPDKTSYKVGETAKILIKSLVPVTKALATLERGRLLEYKVIDLGGNAAHIELPITEGMIPNLYLSIVAHVGRSSAPGGEHPPLLYHGETEIAVEPEQKRLNVSIVTDRTGEGENPPVYRPGETVKVRLETKDAGGKPKKAHVMVSVADESVLRLLNYRLPDLVKKFYFRRPNSVATSSSLLSLKAGDAGSGAAKKRRIFKDTAHFEAHVVTNDQGRGEFSFTLPDDLTTWVIEALAITDSKTTEAFETERQQAIGIRPPGQTSLQSDLVLTDDTFVGGQRGKIMTTLPVVVRSALPRFAVWGDEVKGRVILNNRNPQPIDGKITVSVSGDAKLKNNRPTQEMEFSVPAGGEQALPVELAITGADQGKLIFSVNAKDGNGQGLDALEISLPVKDRFAPEIVASSGMTDTEEKELVDLPPDTVKEKGGLDVSFKASLALAAAPSLRELVDYPWDCSEQKSATLMAYLITKEMTERFGDAYFDNLAPQSAKRELLDEKIQTLADELFSKFQAPDGGIKYWPENEKGNFFASVQTLVTLNRARQAGFTVEETATGNIKKFIRAWLNEDKTHLFRLYVKTGRRLTAFGDWEPGWDIRAYAQWGLTSDGTLEFYEDVLKHTKEMSPAGLSYLLMSLKDQDTGEERSHVAKRLMALAKQEPRHVSWPASEFFWSTEVKNTALAAWALLGNDPTDPNVPRALAFLLNRKKTGEHVSTQDALALSLLLSDYAKIAQEDLTDFKATLVAGAQTLIEKTFNRANLLSEQGAKVAMKDLTAQPMPLDLKIGKSGEGRLYYDMVLKYYLPPAKTPTREEGLIVSREYYALDDVKELKPLTEFKVGENYKGHITLVVPQDMNYVMVQDLLPAGFEPVDMTLATTSKAAGLEARAGGGEDDPSTDEGTSDKFFGYDDVVMVTDYGTDYGFAHQEIRDDSILWSDEVVPPGTYHIRYPVRATTAGTFLMPGALAFEFYEPEIFGRSRGRMVEIDDRD